MQQTSASGNPEMNVTYVVTREKSQVLDVLRKLNLRGEQGSVGILLLSHRSHSSLM